MGMIPDKEMHTPWLHSTEEKKGGSPSDVHRWWAAALQEETKAGKKGKEAASRGREAMAL